MSVCRFPAFVRQAYADLHVLSLTRARATISIQHFHNSHSMREKTSKPTRQTFASRIQTLTERQLFCVCVNDFQDCCSALLASGHRGVATAVSTALTCKAHLSVSKARAIRLRIISWINAVRSVAFWHLACQRRPYCLSVWLNYLLFNKRHQTATAPTRGPSSHKSCCLAQNPA